MSGIRGAERRRLAIWEQTLLKLRSGLEPRPGRGLRVPDRREVDDLTAWIESELDRKSARHWPVRPTLRLGRVEYANSMDSMLGLKVDVGALLPQDEFTSGFVQNRDFLSSPTVVGAYVVAAAVISRMAVEASRTDSPSRRAIFVCRPDEGNESDCMPRIFSRLARYAFRRPAAGEDVNAMMSIYRAARHDGGMERGLELAIRALLTDPKFLNRLEVEPGNVVLGQAYRITDLELASGDYRFSCGALRRRSTDRPRGCGPVARAPLLGAGSATNAEGSAFRVAGAELRRTVAEPPKPECRKSIPGVLSVV